MHIVLKILQVSP